MGADSDAEYCAAQVRRYDYHRYFAAGFIPPERRRSVLAVYAFNLEIASIRELVSEPLIGQMRLQWWRDTIGEVFDGSVRGHAVARELARAIGDAGLESAPFMELLDARAFDLGEEPPEDLAALVAYARSSAGPLFRLADGICSGEAGETAAKEAGVAWALSGLLRAAPLHAAQGCVYLPLDLLRQQRLVPANMHKELAGNAGRTVAAAVATRAAEAYAAAAIRLRGVSRLGRAPFLYLAVAGRYLRRLESAAHDVTAIDARSGRLGDQLAILRAALSGRL